MRCFFRREPGCLLLQTLLFGRQHAVDLFRRHAAGSYARTHEDVGVERVAQRRFLHVDVSSDSLLRGAIQIATVTCDGRTFSARQIRTRRPTT